MSEDISNPNSSLGQRKLRVAIVHHGESSPVDAGYRPQRYGQLAAELERRGHDVVRLLPAHPHRSQVRRMPSVWKDKDGTVLHLKTPYYVRSRSLRRLRFLRSFDRQVRRTFAHDVGRCDVVIVGLPPPMGRSTIRTFREASASIIVDVRDVWPDAQIAVATGLERAMFRAVSSFIRNRVRRSLVNADAVVAVSAEYACWAAEHLQSVTRDDRPPRPRPQAIPIGATTQKAARATVPPKPPCGIFVGSMNAQFDFSMMVRAWRAATRDGANGETLEIVGDGPSLAGVREHLRGLKGAQAAGRVDSMEAARLMSRATVGLAPYAAGAVMTSTNKIAEYLAAGLPVVTTLRSELTRALESTGAVTIVSHADIGGYANAIRKYLDWPAADARSVCEDAFDSLLSAEVLAARFADLVERVFPGTRR